MPTYLLKVPCTEAHAYYEVGADSEAEAIAALKAGNGVHKYDEALDEQQDKASVVGEVTQ